MMQTLTELFIGLQGWIFDTFVQPVLFALGRLPGWLAQWEEMLNDKEQKALAENPSNFAEIYIMKADGSDQRRLTDFWGYDLDSSEVRLLPAADVEELRDPGAVPSVTVDGTNGNVWLDGRSL